MGISTSGRVAIRSFSPRSGPWDEFGDNDDAIGLPDAIETVFGIDAGDTQVARGELDSSTGPEVAYGD